MAAKIVGSIVALVVALLPLLFRVLRPDHHALLTREIELLKKVEEAPMGQDSTAASDLSHLIDTRTWWLKFEADLSWSSRGWRRSLLTAYALASAALVFGVLVRLFFPQWGYGLRIPTVLLVLAVGFVVLAVFQTRTSILGALRTPYIRKILDEDWEEKWQARVDAPLRAADRERKRRGYELEMRKHQAALKTLRRQGRRRRPKPVGRGSVDEAQVGAEAVDRQAAKDPAPPKTAGPPPPPSSGQLPD